MKFITCYSTVVKTQCKLDVTNVVYIYPEDKSDKINAPSMNRSMNYCITYSKGLCLLPKTKLVLLIWVQLYRYFTYFKR